MVQPDTGTTVDRFSPDEGNPRKIEVIDRKQSSREEARAFPTNEANRAAHCRTRLSSVEVASYVRRQGTMGSTVPLVAASGGDGPIRGALAS